MSQLDDIIQTVSINGASYPSWIALRHAYFTSDNPIKECNDWACNNGLIALFKYKEDLQIIIFRAHFLVLFL